MGRVLPLSVGARYGGDTCRRMGPARIDCLNEWEDAGGNSIPASSGCDVFALIRRADGIVYRRDYARGCRTAKDSHVLRRHPRWRGPARQAPPL